MRLSRKLVLPIIPLFFGLRGERSRVARCGPVMHQSQMLLSVYRCIKAKCYRAIFQSLATFASIEFLSWTGLSWTYRLVKLALVSKGISLAARTRWKGVAAVS